MGELGLVRNFIPLCVHYIPLLMLFNKELLRKGNISGEGRKAGFLGGGGGGG